MRVMGVDPGHVNIGFAIVDIQEKDMHIHFAQDINLSDQKNRYKKLYDLMNDIVESYNPHLIIIEKTVVRNNSLTSLLLSQSRGVILLLCEQKAIHYEEVANNRVKKYFCGQGNATKETIALEIFNKFNIKLLPNANDALMIAYYGKNFLTLKY